MTDLLYAYRCTQVYSSASSITPPSVTRPGGEITGVTQIGTATVGDLQSGHNAPPFAPERPPRVWRINPQASPRFWALSRQSNHRGMRRFDTGANTPHSTECRSSEDVDRVMEMVAEKGADCGLHATGQCLRVDAVREYTYDRKDIIAFGMPRAGSSPAHLPIHPTATGTSFISPGIFNGPRCFLR